MYIACVVVVAVLWDKKYKEGEEGGIESFFLCLDPAGLSLKKRRDFVEWA